MMRFFCIILLSISLVNIPCNAASMKVPKENRKQYQAEMNKVIDNDIITIRKKVDEANAKAKNIYQAFLQDKNQMKRNYDFYNQLDNLGLEIGSVEFDLYLNLIKTTGKYLDIKNTVPATDYAGTLSDFIRPYMKKNKIDCAKIDKQIEYNRIKRQEIDNIRIKIYNYSLQYEETKAKNFYEKNVEPKVNNTQPQALMNTIMSFQPFRTNVFYYGNPVVIQIFQDGFLADLAPGQDQFQSVIFVQDRNSSRLLRGDYFDPFLPVKFTGRYFTYTNIYGERRVVPIFNVYLPTYKKQSLPQIKETFYFAAKPHWDGSALNNHWAIDHISLLNERRLYYSRWK